MNSVLYALRFILYTLYYVQDEVVLFIMNKCWWNWWGEEMQPALGLSPDEMRRSAAAVAQPAAARGATIRTLYGRSVGTRRYKV